MLYAIIILAIYFGCNNNKFMIKKKMGIEVPKQEEIKKELHSRAMRIDETTEQYQAKKKTF